jgi:hypothetical protein
MRVLAALALSACYSPQLPRCEVTCGSNSPCPADLTCGSDSYCHAADDTAACHAVLTVIVHGDGVVSSNPAGIACTPLSPSCQQEFTGGTSITLSASALGTGEFAQWNGDACAGLTQPTCTFPLEISMSMTATFR